MSTQTIVERNRANATKSTGPRTTLGKERSKRNALKHGLRAKDVVLPTEDAGEFQEFLGAWVEDWQPPSMARRHLVEQAAVASWRIKRCQRLANARDSKRVDAAGQKWDERVNDDINKTLEDLREDPAGVLEKLTETRAGVEALIGIWHELREAAASPEGWNDYDDHFLFIHLHGYCPADAPVVALRDMSMRLIVMNNPEDAEATDTKPANKDEAERICDEIRAIAARKADELLALRKLLPEATADRNDFAEQEGLASRPGDALLARYEAQQHRLYKSSLDQLIRLHRSGADVIEAAAPEETPPPGAVAPNEAKPAEAEPPSQPAQPSQRCASEPKARKQADRVEEVLPVDRVKQDKDESVWSSDGPLLDATKL